MYSVIRQVSKSNLTTILDMSKRKLNDFAEFKKVLDNSKNIIVLTGAGVSAESGIPVFRGAGGLWRKYSATSLASPEAFRANPALVWEFYHYRRNVAFNAEPNNVSSSKMLDCFYPYLILTFTFTSTKSVLFKFLVIIS